MRALPMILLSALLASGCAAQAPAQKVRLQSGDFGVTELAFVRSVDPIILDNDKSRFNVAFGELAVSIITESGSTSAEIWQETARAFGSAFTAELEEYIRGLACVYTVAPEGMLINDIVVEQVRNGGDLLLEDDGSTLIAAYQAGAVEANSRTALDAMVAVNTDIQAEQTPPEIDEFSIISNCIIGVHQNTKVRLVKTGSRAIILPQTAD